MANSSGDTQGLILDGLKLVPVGRTFRRAPDQQTVFKSASTSGFVCEACLLLLSPVGPASAFMMLKGTSVMCLNYTLKYRLHTGQEIPPWGVSVVMKEKN